MARAAATRCVGPLGERDGRAGGRDGGEMLAGDEQQVRPGRRHGRRQAGRALRRQAFRCLLVRGGRLGGAAGLPEEPAEALEQPPADLGVVDGAQDGPDEVDRLVQRTSPAGGFGGLGPQDQRVDRGLAGPRQQVREADRRCVVPPCLAVGEHRCGQPSGDQVGSDGLRRVVRRAPVGRHLRGQPGARRGRWPRGQRAGDRSVQPPALRRHQVGQHRLLGEHVPEDVVTRRLVDRQHAGGDRLAHGVGELGLGRVTARPRACRGRSDSRSWQRDR